MPALTRIVRLICFQYNDSHKRSASIQDGITLIIYAMEYLDDSLANPIMMIVIWDIRRLANVRPPESSEQK